MFLKDEERNSGRGTSSAFTEWVDRRAFIDLEFSGPLFTWNHGSDVTSRRSA